MRGGLPRTLASLRAGAIMGRVTRLIGILLAVAVFPAGEAAGAPPAQVCGHPGTPPCPLQRWMRENASVAYAKRDAARVAAVLEQAAALNPEPERWRKWASIALSGASRVRRGGPEATLSACVGCHDTYRAEYVKSYRTRRLPSQ
jgi:hypothetical protein